MEKMVDLKRSPAAVKKESNVNYKPSPYGYGTRLELSHEDLVKLGVKELPEAGDEYSITATAKVTSASKSVSDTGSRTSMSLQITHLKLTHEDEAAEKKETPAQEQAEQIKPAKKATPMFQGGIGKLGFR